MTQTSDAPTPRATRPGRTVGAARRARAALLTGLAAFALLQIALGWALEVWFPQKIDPAYAARLQRYRDGRAADPGRTRTVLMLGSSRAYYGFQADALNEPLARGLGRPVSVVNAACCGAGPVTELLLWRRLRHDGARPDLLLIEVMPARLSTSAPPVDEVSEQRLPTRCVRRVDLPVFRRYAPGARPGLRLAVEMSQVVPLYFHRLELLTALSPALTPAAPALPFGPAGPRQLPFDGTVGQRDRALEQARREYADTLAAFHLGGAGCEALCELLDSCRRDGVPAALVVMPEGPVFRRWYPPGSWDAVRGWLGQTSHEYGAPVIDAHEWFGEDAFLDSHHLLPAGAAAFTERIGEEYLLPLLRRP